MSFLPKTFNKISVDTESSTWKIKGILVVYELLI